MCKEPAYLDTDVHGRNVGVLAGAVLRAVAGRHLAALDGLHAGEGSFHTAKVLLRWTFSEDTTRIYFHIILLGEFLGASVWCK